MNKIMLLHLFAFFFGSIPFGYLLGKLNGVDIRKEGSGNIGATNVSRVLGKKKGYVTLIADITKGFLAVCLGYLVPENTVLLSSESFAASLGLAAIIGHCYSPFLKFNGGKGVATSLGVFIALAPINALITVIVFVVTLKIWNYVSLSSILAAAALPISYALNTYVMGTNKNGIIMVVALVAASIVASRHKTNIYRLRAGTEPKIKLSPKHQEQSAT